jgi:pyruvate,orthophosphate dikinase
MTQTLQDWKKKLASGQATYSFEEGRADMRNTLGGKGANLAEMTNLGFPVPPGFIITTEVCNVYSEMKQMPPGLDEEVMTRISELEKKMGKGFGSSDNPLLLSIRSGARFSMPGMMDTVLNLGLNDDTVQGLIKQSGDPRFAYDAYRRFIQMFADVVMGLPKHEFEHIISHKKTEKGVVLDKDLSAEALQELVKEFKDKFRREAGREFPTDVKEQLMLSVEGVFKSWNNPRAFVYRNKEKIPHDLGTAVNVQSMVFGNLGEDSGTGVAFTRNYNTGAKKPVGDFLINAQGEDVVAGIRTPLPLEDMEKSFPELWNQLADISHKLEQHYKDMQDMEFTIEKGKLFMLQTRTGKRTAASAIQIAVDMVEEGLIDEKTAVLRVAPEQLDRLLHPYIPDHVKKQAKVLAKGTNASPGAACGKVVFEANDAVAEAEKGHAVVLVRPETTPDDAHGMAVAKGILTSTGGPSSHAALVARGWGIPCIVGCEALKIDLNKKRVTCGDITFGEGDMITIDGGTGEVFLAELELHEPTELSPETQKVLGWADKYRKLGVYANADTPTDAQRARNFGAEGIGLCRTEHMFMEKDRLPVVQEMIMIASAAETGARQLRKIDASLDGVNKESRQYRDAQDEIARVKAKMDAPWSRYNELLARLAPFQRGDFEGILEAMNGHWVIIRLLDPPLHEFLPAHNDLLVDVTRLKTLKEMDASAFDKALADIRKRRGDDKVTLESLEEVLHKVEAMHEANPMLGQRFCRLGIVFPEIYKMQVRAIMEAACNLKKKGVDAKPEIMIPGIGSIEEMMHCRAMAEQICSDVQKEKGVQVDHKIGTMIELPRATAVAYELANHADFFSFGTNDLTQTTYGYSRDDAAGTFMPVYLEQGVLKADPFQVVDRKGVGRLMKMAVNEGRNTNPNLEVGICGEHGGDPESVEFCHELGLNYVSCSPFRVPIARLAAAHAALKAAAPGGPERDR